MMANEHYIKNPCMLDTSDIDKKYQPIIGCNLKRKYHSDVIVTNSDIGLTMKLHEWTLSFSVTDSFKDKYEGWIMIHDKPLGFKPSKYLISILVEWFANLKKIPWHLCYQILVYGPKANKYMKKLINERKEYFK